MQGLDAYTGEQIAGAQGTGSPSFSTELPLLLEEAVLAHLDNFNSQLMAHFTDLAANGRKVKINIKTWDNWDGDLEEEYELDGEEDELSTLIENWMEDNAFKGNYHLADATETMMKFDIVRIPMFYTRKGKQRAMDTRRFVNGLRKYLKKGDTEIVSKLYMRGLGEAWLILGEK